MPVYGHGYMVWHRASVTHTPRVCSSVNVFVCKLPHQSNILFIYDDMTLYCSVLGSLFFAHSLADLWTRFASFVLYFQSLVTFALRANVENDDDFYFVHTQRGHGLNQNAKRVGEVKT